MKMTIKLAWRNLWRNKRRTLISISAVLFAVLFASVISSFQKGTWDHMVDNVVRYYLGYAQVHQKGFWDDQTLDNSFDAADLPPGMDQDLALTPRLESFALASSGELTKGVLVVGVDPALENSMTKLESRLVAGQYLLPTDSAVLLSEGLAALLNLGVGDTMVLLGQGYQGSNAVGAFAVKGIARFGSPELNKQLVFLPLALAQGFYAAENRLTSLALNLASKQELPEALVSLKNLLGDDQFEILDFKQLMPELIEAQELDSAGSKLILWVLYLLIAFGLFGTVLMMARERTYEFGVLTAIGTPKRTLLGMLLAETLLIGFTGAVAGILLSLPVVWLLHTSPIRLSGKMAQAYQQYGIEPVIKTAFDSGIFLQQALVVFVISVALAVYPMNYVRKISPVQAMRG